MMCFTEGLQYVLKSSFITKYILCRGFASSECRISKEGHPAAMPEHISPILRILPTILLIGLISNRKYNITTGTKRRCGRYLNIRMPIFSVKCFIASFAFCGSQMWQSHNYYFTACGYFAETKAHFTIGFKSDKGIHCYNSSPLNEILIGQQLQVNLNECDSKFTVLINGKEI